MEKYGHNVKFLRKRDKATWKDRPPILTFWRCNCFLHVLSDFIYIYLYFYERVINFGTVRRGGYIHPCNQYREINRNMNAIRSQIFNTCPQTPFFPQRVKYIFRNGTNSRIGLSGKQRRPHIPIPVITQTKNTKIWANVQYRDPTCHIFILPYPLPYWAYR
jgi:hypothetical protein